MWQWFLPACDTSVINVVCDFPNLRRTLSVWLQNCISWTRVDRDEVWVCRNTLQKETDTPALAAVWCLTNYWTAMVVKCRNAYGFSFYQKLLAMIIYYWHINVTPAEIQQDFTKSDLNVHYLDPVWIRCCRNALLCTYLGVRTCCIATNRPLETDKQLLSIRYLIYRIADTLVTIERQNNCHYC